MGLAMKVSGRVVDACTGSTIRRAAKDNPGAPILVTGCAAQIDPDMFANMPEVSRVIGNHEKMQAGTWTSPALNEGREKILVNDIMSVKETAAHLIDGMEGRARAYVQVQNGCDHRCTFCIIPYGRGNSRSVPAGDVVQMVRRLVETGHYEVVLTGVDLTSYGPDLLGAPMPGDLIKAETPDQITVAWRRWIQMRVKIVDEYNRAGGQLGAEKSDDQAAAIDSCMKVLEKYIAKPQVRRQLSRTLTQNLQQKATWWNPGVAVEKVHIGVDKLYALRDYKRQYPGQLVPPRPTHPLSRIEPMA